jgi:hypothetical protein
MKKLTEGFWDGEAVMCPRGRHEQARRLAESYRKASRREKSTILTAFCLTTGLNRKYAIGLLRQPPEEKVGVRRRRRFRYSEESVKVLVAIWEAADFPWSVRLKAMVPLWLPRLGSGTKVTAGIEAELMAMSPRTMDRRLRSVRVAARRRLYGRTKPGTLLKHQIPVRTERWDVDEAGWAEIDLVSHSGPAADGEFAHSLNLTDIHSTWVETRALLGKGQAGVLAALKSIREELPFQLKGLDSDNGSEFVNHHLYAFCKQQKISLTRGRPYKKDDNAHIEQKNWTHVRRLVGWERIDSPAAVTELNELYRREWRWMMNLFQPSVKLLRKERVGSRVRRVYDAPATPLDRLLRDASVDQDRLAELVALRQRLDPFQLSHTIQHKIDRVHRTARRSDRPRPTLTAPAASHPTRPRLPGAHPLLVPPPQGGGRPLPEATNAQP